MARDVVNITLLFSKDFTHLEVVAPPISNGIFISSLSISLATNIISSKEGVMRPDRPIKSIKENWF